MSSPFEHRTMMHEAGFTLVEVLVTMLIGLVVLFAVLQGSEVFSRGATAADRATASQDAARATLRQIVGELRQARVVAGQSNPLPVARPVSRRDVVFSAYVPTSTGSGDQPGWRRYCTVPDGSGISLMVGTLSNDAYTDPGSCPSVSGTVGPWSYGKLINKRLQVPETLFDFTSSTCIASKQVVSNTAVACTPAPGDVRTVGIQLSVGNGQGTDAGNPQVLRDAVSFRNHT